MVNINSKGQTDNDSGGPHYAGSCHVIVVGSDYDQWPRAPGIPRTLLKDQSSGANFLAGASGDNLSLTVFTQWAGISRFFFEVNAQPTALAMDNWRNSVWNTLYAAAQTEYYATQQQAQARLNTLQDQINNVDTLTLRREENDEIMKCVLQSIFGVDFNFMPDNVVGMFQQNNDPTAPSTTPNQSDAALYGIAFTGAQLNFIGNQWSIMGQHEDMIRFINEAIEWENVVYFLYSYFWDIPTSWDFIRSLKHPDSTRQEFLRAGSARVVLTIRQGYEEAWVRFAEAGGRFDSSYSGPYLTIAQEIADYAATNYVGIPPTSPGGGPSPDSGNEAATQTTGALSPPLPSRYPLKWTPLPDSWCLFGGN